MITQSTSIVHGRVTGSYAAFRGPVIYTLLSGSGIEQWKGTSQSAVEVRLPGGTANGSANPFPARRN